MDILMLYYIIILVQQHEIVKGRFLGVDLSPPARRGRCRQVVQAAGIANAFDSLNRTAPHATFPHGKGAVTSFPVARGHLLPAGNVLHG